MISPSLKAVVLKFQLFSGRNGHALSVCVQYFRWEKWWEIDFSYYAANRNLRQGKMQPQRPDCCSGLFSHHCSLTVWSQAPWPGFCLCSPFLQLAISKHSSNTVQWKDTVYNPKCSRSFCIISSPWDLLSRTVEHSWPLLFTFPSSSKLHDTKESDGVQLRFPTHRGISVTFRLRHGLLHLPSIFS